MMRVMQIIMQGDYRLNIPEGAKEVTFECTLYKQITFVTWNWNTHVAFCSSVVPHVLSNVQYDADKT